MHVLGAPPIEPSTSQNGRFGSEQWWSRQLAGFGVVEHATQDNNTPTRARMHGCSWHMGRRVDPCDPELRPFLERAAGGRLARHARPVRALARVRLVLA